MIFPHGRNRFILHQFRPKTTNSGRNRLNFYRFRPDDYLQQINPSIIQPFNPSIIQSFNPSTNKKSHPEGWLFTYFVKSKLLRDNASHFQHFVRVAPLVVVPSANLNECRVELDTCLLVEDRSVRVVAEVS